jgi:Domain of unknown function (DUF4173)
VTAGGFRLTGLATPADDAHEAAAPRAASAAALGAAILAATAIPGNPPGLGVLVSALAVGAAVVLARPTPLSIAALIHGSLALLLTSMVVLRSAEWVLLLDLTAALGLSTLVVGDRRTWRDHARAPLAVLARVPAAAPFLWRPFRRIPRRAGRLAPVLRGSAIGLVLLVVFGSLFLSADAAFARLAEALLIPSWDLSLMPARVVVFGGVLLFIGAVALTGPRYTIIGSGSHEVPARRLLGRAEWGIALALLDLLFLAFVLVQLTVLFGGRDHVLETAGLTYAEYARQGFFQLVGVGALTLVVIAGASRWSSRSAPADRLLLQVMLGLLCLLTLVILASALRRLTLYESEFGYTHVRLSVHAAILWMGAILALVMVAGVRMRGAWLPRAAVVLTAVSLIVFTLIDPDGLVASNNVQHYRETGRIDVSYLSTLSADAVPALAELPEPLRSCALAGPARSLSEPTSWAGYNAGRMTAREVLAAVEPFAVSADVCAFSSEEGP